VFVLIDRIGTCVELKLALSDESDLIVDGVDLSLKVIAPYLRDHVVGVSSLPKSKDLVTSVDEFRYALFGFSLGHQYSSGCCLMVVCHVSSSSFFSVSSRSSLGGGLSADSQAVPLTNGDTILNSSRPSFIDSQSGLSLNICTATAAHFSRLLSRPLRLKAVIKFFKA
jgi:hypothetical protein